MEVTQRQITEKGLGVAMMTARVIFLHLLHIYSLISINGKKKHTVRDGLTGLGTFWTTINASEGVIMVFDKCT